MGFYVWFFVLLLLCFYFFVKNPLFVTKVCNSFYNFKLFSILKILQDLWPIIRVLRYRPSIFNILYFSKLNSFIVFIIKKKRTDFQQLHNFWNWTRKSKTEAVLQRRSMLKLGVICNFRRRNGKCFMSWNGHLEFKCYAWKGWFFCLFQVYRACTHFRPLFAVYLVVYLNKHNIDNDVFKLIVDSSVTLLCGC